MSADNWGVCPKCLQKKHKTMEDLKSSYGKVSSEEYHRLLKEVNEAEGDLDDATLREDYEIAMLETGVFSIGYSCSCECGFKFNFKHNEAVPIS